MSAALWVTGLGLVTPLGIGVEATWERLVRGDRAIAPLRLFDATGVRAPLAAEVDGVAVPAGGGWSRTSAFAALAAEEAMKAARVDVHAARVGLVVGGTTGGMFENERLLAQLHADPACRGAHSTMLSHPLSAAGDRLAEALGPFARVRSVSSACSTGANAIVVAANWLLADEVDIVVAGASDGLCRLTVAGFNALAALDPETCRPFDRRRRGTTLGEGAGFVVLERARKADARGATAIAVLSGWAVGSEAHHVTHPDPEGALVSRLIEAALERAGRSPADVDYVNAHGTGTPQNDVMEARALRRALGSEMDRIPVSSDKGQLGHTLGAAGAIEAAITALVVSRRTLVPTAGLDEPDAELRLVHVPHVGRAVERVRVALSNAFGFGGMDTVLAFAEPSEASAAYANAAPAAVDAVVTGASIFARCGRLGAAECARLTSAPARAEGVVDPDSLLDADRARRYDRTARLAVVAVEHALAESGASAEPTGLVLGSAFGQVDGSAAFVRRLLDRGPRAASPAEFPSLVPSAPVGHASIYLGLRGPAFAVSDLSASGECAFTQAAQLVQRGGGTRVVAGAVEARSDIVEGVFALLFSPYAEQAPRACERVDLAAAVVLESAPSAKRRGARSLARVRQVLEWRGDGIAPIAQLLRPGVDAEVVLARESPLTSDVLAATPWASCPRHDCANALEESEALGAAALAVAASRVGLGLARECLVLGVVPGRGYAIVLGAP